MCSNTRVGLVVFALHDPSDVFLQTAKQFRYFGWERACNACFALFAVCWVITRCLWFPHATYYTSLDVARLIHTHILYPTALLQVLCLWALICLHIYWSYLIFAMVYRSLVVKTVEKDIRSDSDEDEPVQAAAPASPAPVAGSSRAKPLKQE